MAADKSAIPLLAQTYFGKKLPEDNSKETYTREGIVIGDRATELVKLFIELIKLHRFWEREKPRKVPA